MLLSDLSIGMPMKISSIGNLEDIGLRLLKLGFEAGSVVEVLHFGFPYNDPIAVRVNDHTVALGKAEAALVTVEAL